MKLMTKRTSLILSAIVAILLINSTPAGATGDITLYTPYTRISVPPGEVIDYSIDVINKSTELKNIDISLSGLPRAWIYDLKSGGYDISQISVLPGERKSLNLKVEVPLKVNKGTYNFSVEAAGMATLPLSVTVTTQGTFRTEFTPTHINMEGSGSTLFTYQASLKNRTGEKQLYALAASAPRGWNVVFKVNYKQASSVELEANVNSDISIEIDPPDKVQAGTYKIPVRASTSATSSSFELEVVITGSYAMGLSTPTGLLSADITAGNTKRLELLITNSGSTEIKDIRFNSTAPVNWEVVFEPMKVDRLEAGKNVKVFATIKADKKAIAGDYVTHIQATTPEVSADNSFRISVKTPMLYGWIGVLLIIGALWSVYYLFRRFGRR